MIWGPCLPPPAPPMKDRIKGSSYLCRGGVRIWDGKQMRNKQESRNQNRKRHKGAHKVSNKAYYEAHKEEINAYREAYRKAHKEEQKAYSEAHKPQRNKLRNERRKTDPIYKLNCLLSGGLRAALKAQGASKNNRTLKYSCCTLAFLYAHLKKQFTTGMTWENHGEWHIDHRKPKAKFNLKNEEEIYMMQHWTNLQPMWASENIAKGGDYDPETFTHEWMGIDIGWQLKNYSFQQLIL